MARIRVLVTVESNVDLPQAIRSWQALGFVESSIMHPFPVVQGEIDGDAVPLLKKQSGVKAVDPEHEVRALG